MPEHADILADLHGLRVDGPGFLDLVTALCIGLCLAATLGLVTRLFRQRAATSRIGRRLREARNMPRDERIAALAALLREITDKGALQGDGWPTRAARRFGLDADMLAQVQAELYAPAPRTDPDVLEKAVARAAKLARV